ncbi:MAG TPA: malto-oligosyltrehalose trehalohydrolase [Minicystis sp.]|nr:malto-oligosyltrehalose trehalohydrolase [Minicystis sp.]
MSRETPELGAFPEAGGVRFVVWSSHAREVAVRLFDERAAPVRDASLAARGGGVFASRIEAVGPGALYKFVLDGRELPDPYARELPFGVHGPARVAARVKGPPALGDAARRVHRGTYELHVGAFTEAGTFAAAIERLDHVASLGAGAIELMPVSSFPGRWGWGYDGVAHFAPQRTYGSPDALRALVAEAHRRGLAVLMDVVFNHFGPDGNYLGAYSPEYFGGRDTTWGTGPDFENPFMRAYALDNARMWFDEFGVDGLRLDATHAIHDGSPRHVLRDLADVASACAPPRLLVAEDERNDPALVTELGMNAVWADDFHHQVRVLLTGERDGYFSAFAPDVADLATLVERGWLYEGQVSPWTRAPRGGDAHALTPPAMVYAVQNHDQIGNRAFGTRLDVDAGSIDALLAGVTLLLFLPASPLLFMGQEWGASTPFLFFSDHEGELGAAVTRGRREEFRHFAAFSDPERAAKIPDPQAESTFVGSKLRWDELGRAPHDRALVLHRALLALRRDDPVIADPTRRGLVAEARGRVLAVTRGEGDARRLCVVNFGDAPAAPFTPRGPEARWTRLVGTHDDAALVPPRGAAIYRT